MSIEKFNSNFCYIILIAIILFFCGSIGNRKFELIKEIKLFNGNIKSIKAYKQYVYILTDNKIIRINGDITEFGRFGMEEDEFVNPIEINIYKGKIYVLDKGAKKIKIFDKCGNYIKSFSIDEDDPISMAIDNGKIFVLDKFNYNINIYSNRGKYCFSIFKNVDGLINNLVSIDVNNGNVYIAGENKIYIFSEYGDYIRKIDIKGCKSISVSKFIAITGNKKVKIFDENLTNICNFKSNCSTITDNKLYTIFNDTLKIYKLSN